MSRTTKTIMFTLICFSFIACNGLSESSRFNGFRFAIGEILRTKPSSWD